MPDGSAELQENILAGINCFCAEKETKVWGLGHYSSNLAYEMYLSCAKNG